jgi:hypothetical protein
MSSIYVIACFPSPGELSKTVTKYINDGYLPVGGPFIQTEQINAGSSHSIWCQALLKRNSET